MKVETVYIISKVGNYLFEICDYLRSAFSIIVTLLLTSVILNINIPINTASVGQFAQSLLLFWGYIYLINVILIIPLYVIGLIIRNLPDNVSEKIYRILLIVAVIISMLIQTTEIVRVGGIIGLALTLVLYIIKRKWFLFPGNALSSPDEAYELFEKIESERNQRMAKGTDITPSEQ